MASGHRRDLGFPKLSHIGAGMVCLANRCISYAAPPSDRAVRCGGAAASGNLLLDSSFPEFTRITLQEVDDLVAHRAVLVDAAISGGEEQLPCTAETRLELRAGEEDGPVRFGAFAADNVGCVSSRERADRDCVFAGSVGGLDG